MEKNINYQEIETQCKSAIIKAGKISKELKKNIKVHYKSENQPVTNKADSYSVGALYYFMLYGKE